MTDGTPTSMNKFFNSSHTGQTMCESIIQGSVVGSASFVIVASDIHPKHRKNLMSKYADDTYLFIGTSMLHTAIEEYMRTSTHGALKNSLKTHPSKTTEMIVVGRSSPRF